MSQIVCFLCSISIAIKREFSILAEIWKPHVNAGGENGADTKVTIKCEWNECAEINRIESIYHFIFAICVPYHII